MHEPRRQMTQARKGERDAREKNTGGKIPIVTPRRVIYKTGPKPTNTKMGGVEQ